MADHSLQDMLQGNWKQLQGSVRREWGKLTQNDVEQVNGNLEVLSGKIQERYGMAQAEAKKQIEQWASNYQARQMEQSNTDTDANETV